MSLKSLVESKAKPVTTTSTATGLAKFAKPKAATSTDLSTIEGLTQAAQTAGFGKEAGRIVDSTPKLSALQRLGEGLGAFNPAEAVLTGMEKGFGAGLKEYPKSILQGVGAAITGKDYTGERRGFKEVAEKLGVKNGIAKFGIGFVGDVLLDPSTYFGGALVKGGLNVAKGVSKVGVKGLTKVAPEVARGLGIAGTAIEDAFGKAFQYGYKSSKGAKEGVLDFMSKTQRAKLGLAASNLDRLGTGILTQSQREELVLKLIAGKRAEFELGGKVSEDAMAIVNRLFPDIKVKDPQHAQSILDNLESTTSKNIEAIRAKVDEIIKPYFESRQAAIKSGQILESTVGVQKTPALGSFRKVDDLNRVVDGLREQLALLRKQRGSVGAIGKESIDDLGGLITKEEAVRTHNSLIKYEEERLAETIDDLYAQIDRAKAKPQGGKISKLPRKELTPAELAVYAERKILKLQNDLVDKSRLLTTATRGRTSGTALIKAAKESGDWSKIQKIAPDLVEKLKMNSSDPLVQKTLEKQILRTKGFAEQSGITNPYETYFPFIKADKVEKFLNETKGIKVGSEGYRKQFKNLLTNENLELDPAKAFFTRESQIVSDRMTRDFLGKFVKDYGQPLEAFKNSDEAANAGYKLIKEKGMFGKEVGWVKEFDAKLLRDSLSPEFQTVSMLAKATGFDAVTSLFKRSVTGLFAPFHVRNFASGMIQNFEVLGVAALNPKNIAAGQKIAYLMGKGEKIPAGMINVGGKEMKFSSVMKPFMDRFSGDTFYNADFDMALKSGGELKGVAGTFSKGRLKETAKTLGLGQEAIPFKIGRGIGQFIEHQQKATAYITALSQGKNIPDALKLAEAAGFDYRALTAFESQIMRRIMPFYSFTRKNIELQMKTLGENPQRINQVLKFFENVGDQPSAEERRDLPDYIKESIGIKLKDSPEGLKQYISSFGTPIEAFTTLFGKNPVLRAISMTNPIIKAPIELGTGVDSFRQNQVKENYDAREYKMAPQILKDLLEIKPVQKDILKKDANGKLKKVGERTQYVANPERLLVVRSLFTSRGVSYLDQVFGNDLKGLVKLLKTTTGVKPQQIDIEVTKGVKESKQKRALEDLGKKGGYLNVYQKAYIPKE